MESAERKDFREPDEVRPKSCEAPHFQYHVSGMLRIRMDDGTEFDCKPGDVSLGDARAR